MRILIVDDEPDVVEYLSARLSSKGFQTGGAADGVEAVIQVLRESWDVVLMDIRMPNLDGINALRIIRAARPNLPVVTFTGQAGQGDMAESVRLGAYTCLLKPVSMDKLLDTIKQATSATP
ncbi:MAG TPA: response regulator [Anaerolineaceae bacterium]|nr:response regulator [Anaerolineaceae bacterium]HPN53406.1 response regulator [Anaerolineaceae bacterium]